MMIRTFGLALFLFSLVPIGIAAPLHEIDQNESMLYVEGAGYPPIKSEDPGQARLMARRAAVLDAYRNILLLLGDRKEVGSDEVELAVTFGYIRGAQVVDEILLSDGGVKVRIAYPLSEEELKRFGGGRRATATGSSLSVDAKEPVVLSGPVAVDLETWIEQLKKEREKRQKGIVLKHQGSKTPVAPSQPGQKVRGVHPVTLEQWIAIIKSMKK